ncbi:hypothetical protein NLX83_03955 [Allokutzneria sp. A3M-2-11 16]|uniref:hypothetical protein n=1 Tax=Allokutzneria sp. A3M-2-11 16 TaxID=2962043 RepID=UPI0020B84F75|nr:hypothetical protein [Allokutzneria sp. A3M-2-11 16]MCP3798407.1 hypothetical protein [Allokutzneria sp. A3M-2-11 16]
MGTTVVRDGTWLSDEVTEAVMASARALAATGEQAQVQRLLAARLGLRASAHVAEGAFALRPSVATGDLINVTRTAWRLVEITLGELLVPYGADPVLPVTRAAEPGFALRRLGPPLLRLGNVLWARARCSRIRFVSEQIQLAAGDVLAHAIRWR